jgi:hypothetical protein
LNLLDLVTYTIISNSGQKLGITLEFTSYRVHNLEKFDNTGEDMEDLVSIGTIGLIKAIVPTKGLSWPLLQLVVSKTKS